MLALEPLKEAIEYVTELNKKCQEKKTRPMSQRAIVWMAFCLTSIAITGTLCWKHFERCSAGRWTMAALSAFFRRSGIPWEKILHASTTMILKRYAINSGVLVVDDGDNHRSKKTTMIYGCHKVRNKKGGGFVQAQNITFLLLVTDKITIPVGFEFYRPNPKMKEWKKIDKQQRKKGIPKSKRTPMPEVDVNFPTKKAIGVKLIRKFKFHHSDFKIKSISADNAYFCKKFWASCSRIYPKAQFISQPKKSQHVICPQRGSLPIEKYFSSKKKMTGTFVLRGHLEKSIEFCSARVRIKSHNRKFHIVAYRYSDNEDFRYLCARDLSWNGKEIITSYAWRWLIECEIEDFQLNGGFGRMSLQRGKLGAYRGVTLSLLFEHFLIQHPINENRLRSNQSLVTAGSLRMQLKIDSLNQSTKLILKSESPLHFLKDVLTGLQESVYLRSSRKHMSGFELSESEFAIKNRTKSKKIA